MINFSLNTCWRLIPTQGHNRRNSFVAFLSDDVPVDMLRNMRNTSLPASMSFRHSCMLLNVNA